MWSPPLRLCKSAVQFNVRLGEWREVKVVLHTHSASFYIHTFELYLLSLNQSHTRFIFVRGLKTGQITYCRQSVFSLILWRQPERLKIVGSNKRRYIKRWKQPWRFPGTTRSTSGKGKLTRWYDGRPKIYSFDFHLRRKQFGEIT